MRNLLTLALCAICCFGVASGQKLVTLDLSKATTELKFNETTGAWTETYNDDAESIESQCFTFVHNSISEWNTWWGFTASNSADNAKRDNFITYQFSNMAEGGILLNEDGTIKTDSFGAPEVSAEMPYLVAFYSPYMSERPVDMVLDSSKSYEAVGLYVNLNSYPYYAIQDGDSFARAFTNGDSFKLTIHGVSPKGDEREVVVDLAAYANGNLTINRGWSYVDLTPLGEVNELYFTLKSTDSGEYGDNTPNYFCMDKLMVIENETSGVEDLSVENATISYDRASKTVSVAGVEFAVVYDATGNKVLATDASSFSMDNLSAGVYVVRAGKASVKIAK